MADDLKHRRDEKGWCQRAMAARVRAEEKGRWAAAARANAEILLRDAVDQRRAARELWEAYRARRGRGPDGPVPAGGG